MICKICGQNVKNKGITSHLRKHKMSDKEYYDKYIKSDADGICKVCGKPTKFFGNVLGYGTYCGNSCAQKDNATRQKYEQTCLKKYGATNVYASNYGKNKIKETCRNKYGTDYAFQSNEVREHIKQTNMQKYGVENPQQNREIKKKTSQTNIKRYGNECALQNPALWKKAVHTMKENGNYSKLEDMLEQFFIQNKIKYESQYKDTRYPFHCDFYLPIYDMFIEINGYWHHNGHFFNKNNKEDLKIVKIWTEKSTTRPQYKVALDVWTNKDIQKYNAAKKNKLNYIVLWNKTDIEQFMKNFANYKPKNGLGI